MIADHHANLSLRTADAFPVVPEMRLLFAGYANLERVGKIETLPILQICPCPSQVGDIYVFISRQNLGQSGNSKNPDRLGLSRHMKIRLNRSNRAT